MRLFSILIASFLFTGLLSCAQKDNDVIINQSFELANNTDNTSTIIDKIASSFIGTPYVGHTLEGEKEQLVVKFNGFDCTTFVETVTSLARSVKDNHATVENFTNNLKTIRYRDGVIQAYPSRLHYFTEWLNNNEEKKIIRNITKEIGGEIYNKQINFMSANRDKYPQLANKEFFESIVKTEESINSKTHYYIPKEAVPNILKDLKTGDIIAFTTSVEGLDVVHVGFAYVEENMVKFLHASSGKEKKVVKTQESLNEYIKKKKWMTGIMVARPNF